MRPDTPAPLVRCKSCLGTRPAAWSSRFNRWTQSCWACHDRDIERYRVMKAREAGSLAARLEKDGGFRRAVPLTESRPGWRYHCILCGWGAEGTGPRPGGPILLDAEGRTVRRLPPCCPLCGGSLAGAEEVGYTYPVVIGWLPATGGVRRGRPPRAALSA